MTDPAELHRILVRQLRRLGLDKEVADPAAASGSFKTSWLFAAFAVIAIVAAALFYRQAHDQGSGEKTVVVLPNGQPSRDQAAPPPPE